MPPRTLTSAVVLVSLASLTVLEAGGASKRSESLQSVTRAGLPLVTQATGSLSGEATYSLADYGVRPLPGVVHLCARYELGAKGELITSDLFVGAMPPPILEKALVLAQEERSRSGSVQSRVEPYSKDRLPKSCRRLAPKDSRSLLVLSRVL